MENTTLTPEKLCEAANTGLSQLQALVKEAENIKLQFAAATALEADSYKNPFRIDYELERMIDKVRLDMGKCLVQRFNELLIPNIPIDPESTPREIPAWREQGDACAILRYIQKTYLKDARQKSFEAIVKKARRLLPHVGWKEELTLERVLSKNVLTLHKYIRQDCGANSSFEPDGECDALQKLVRIVLEDADPVTVTAGEMPISQAMSGRKYDEIPKPLTFDSGWITQIRAFKNGKFLVTMKAESSAQRIAKILLDKPKTAE